MAHKIVTGAERRQTPQQLRAERLGSASNRDSVRSQTADQKRLERAAKKQGITVKEPGSAAKFARSTTGKRVQREITARARGRGIGKFTQQELDTQRRQSQARQTGVRGSGINLARGGIRPFNPLGGPGGKDKFRAQSGFR